MPTLYSSSHPFLVQAIPYFRVCMLNCFSRVRLSATPWTVTHLAPLSMGFSRQEYWSGFPCPPPRDPPNSGIEAKSLNISRTEIPVYPSKVSSYMYKETYVWKLLYSCVFLYVFENVYYEICCLRFLFFICLLTIKQVPPLPSSLPFGCLYISVKTTVVILLRNKHVSSPFLVSPFYFTI